MKLLGIETSCDETAVAIVGDDRHIAANLVLSQFAEHRPYGGVVPEIAARSHLDHLDKLVTEAMDAGKAEFADLDGIAATGGPGLIGGVMVGVMTAKAIAAVHNLPFVAVNHLEAHILTPRLVENLEFPYLVLLASGGHCQILIVHDIGNYERLGTTIDDAAGEAFDKVAKLMDLPQPGGPAVEEAATRGDPTRFDLPRPLRGRAGCDFSFSGLKTAVRQLVIEVSGGDRPLARQDRSDIAAAFQTAVGDVMADRLANAASILEDRNLAPMPLIVAGGVAANAYLGERLQSAAAHNRITRLIVPPAKLCTDNGAMVAWAGLENLRRGRVGSLDFEPRPRWPLEDLNPEGSGQAEFGKSDMHAENRPTEATAV
jgi:N6-L-threonylcarbamoyladenine synthase